MEHNSLKFYDSLSIALSPGKPENVVAELGEALNNNGKLKSMVGKLEGKIKRLNKDIEIINEKKLKLGKPLEEQRILKEKMLKEIKDLKNDNERLRKDLEGLKAKYAFDRIEIECTKKEKIEIDSSEMFFNELIKHNQDSLQSDKNKYTVCNSKELKDNKSIPLSLNGKKIAFVGGLDSLIPKYKKMVENLGGTFYCHNGKYTKGHGDIEMLVGKVDLVFCPININSHYACRCAKKNL